MTAAGRSGAGDPPGAEPYLRIARAGAEAWNRWQRTGMDAETAERFGLEATAPLAAEEAAVLARRLGLDALPSYDRAPDFRRVDFTRAENHGIAFARFVFGIAGAYQDDEVVDSDGTRTASGPTSAALFGAASFGDGTRFEGASFGDFTSFRTATFGNGASFRGATFGDLASFDGATFGVVTSFRAAAFGYGALFDGAAFGDRALFTGAAFGDGTRFNDASFGGRSIFDGVTFGNETSFNGATFGDETRFDGWQEAKLRENFERYDVQGTLDERLVEKRLQASRPGHFHSISFADAVFNGRASFCGREFDDEADFSRAEFRAVPDFAGCKELGRLDLTDVSVSFGGGDRWWHLRNWTTQGEVDTRLRRLRKIAKDVEAGDLERDLFILERKAQRGRLFHAALHALDRHWRAAPTRDGFDPRALRATLRDLNIFRPLGLTLWLFLYGAASDYGRSIARPLLALVASFLGFLALYRWRYGAGTARPIALTDPDLLSFTLGNALPFLSSLSPARRDVLLRLFGDGADHIRIPFAIEALSAAQAILGAVLLFLLLLAIRNRFRIA